MSVRYCRLGVLFVVLLSLCLAIGSGGVAGVPGADTDIRPQLANSSDGSTNTSNSTASHTNPAEIDEAGDSQRVADYLTTRLGARLNASAIAVSNEAYEDGRVPLGEDYDALLEQYAAVADDVDAEATVSQFNLTREQQRSIIESAQELNQTGAAYQRAVENGNDEQARELAREILETTEELNETSADLKEQYATLEADTGINLDTASTSLNESQQQVEQVAAAVAQREFTQTEVSVDIDQTELATSSPATVSGQLTTVDNEPIENASISVGIGNDTVTTQTTQNGTFNTTYRPLTAPVDSSTLSVEYEPAPTDPYLPATSTRNVSITEQTDIDVVIENSTETAAFGETVRSTGGVQLPTASNRDLGDVPLVLTVGGQRLETATTDANGTISLAAALPAEIQAGETELGLALERQDLAVAASITTTQLRVQPTATSLSVAAEANTTDTTNVTIAGQLSTEDGTPLSDRELQITLDDTVLGVVETDQTGAYQADYTVSDTVGQTAELTVSYDGTGTSLTESTATEQLSLTTVGWSRFSIGLGASLIVTILAVLFYIRSPEWRWVRRLRARVTNEGAIAEPTSESSNRAPPSSLTTAGGEGDSVTTDGPSLEHAQTALAAGYPNAAVQIAYGVARQQLRADDSQPAETHWEFYRRWQRIGSSDIDSDQLRHLTELYETAAFSPQDISLEAADDIVSTVKDGFRGRKINPEGDD